jgi:hypothetical protein
VAARSLQAEIEAAPIRYVAELVGGSTGAPGEDERAIRRLIALMVLWCDPLAIALTAASTTSKTTLVRSTFESCAQAIDGHSSHCRGH